jgi:hypothetical protein
MYIELDLETVPPTVALREPDDFRRFAVVAGKPEHAFVPEAELQRLAGERAADPDWQRGFEAMVEAARAHGWVDPDGAVRAHLEWR